MKYLKFFPLVFIAVSCTLYMPQTAPIPMMKEKGELQIDGGITFLPGIQGSAAWSPVNHLAVQGHAFTDLGSVQYSQAALGYYNELPKIFRYEVYGGAGFGDGTYYHPAHGDAYDWEMNNSYNLYFLQLNAGRTAGKKQWFEYGLSLKSGMMDQNIHHSGYEIDENYNGYQFNWHYDKKSILLEPSAFLRFGDEFRIGLQVNYANIIPLTYKSEFYDYSPFSVAFTMGFRLNTISKKNKPQISNPE